MEAGASEGLVAAIRTVLQDVDGKLRHAHGRDRVVLLGLRNALQEHLLSVSADEPLAPHHRRPAPHDRPGAG